jgi:hypothetical protein
MLPNVHPVVPQNQSKANAKERKTSTRQATTPLRTLAEGWLNAQKRPGRRQWAYVKPDEAERTFSSYWYFPGANASEIVDV